MKHCSVVAVVAAFVGPVLAQTTWVVNASGGPGVHFTTLAAAVAAATDGDTIRVQHPSMGQPVTGFTTNKGLTIVGESGDVPLVTTGPGFAAPIEIVGLPAARRFRMAGFLVPLAGELRIRVQNCAGQVHLENLHAREPDWSFPTTPAIDISGSASVTLRDVENFGAPAVGVDTSTVLLVSCQLGVTSVGLGGGPCLSATNSTVDVSQPLFQTGWSADCITLLNSDLRLGGSISAVVSGGSVPWWPGTPIATQGGSVTLDPAVQLLASPAASPTVTGTATVTVTSVPASWTGHAIPGQVLSITSTALAGSFVFQALGVPGLPVVTPFGTAGLDLAGPIAFFAPVLVPAGGEVTNQVLIPPALPLGSAHATQSLVLAGTTLSLGLPCTFVVH